MPNMKRPEKSNMTLAKRLRILREEKGMSLDALATKAKVSKTYLWELERDTAGAKKPSAEVLLRLANALSTTIGELLSLPTVRVQETTVELPPGLRELRDRMERNKTPLSAEDLRDLAMTKFRGGQPQTADEWHQLYLFLVNTLRRQKP